MLVLLIAIVDVYGLQAAIVQCIEFYRPVYF